MKSGFLRKLQMFSGGAAMADMALLLLIFFMVTTSSEPPAGAEVTLPVARTEGADQDNLYLTISSDGSLFFDGIRTNREDLRDKLRQRSAEKDRTVAITADAALPYETVSEILGILKEEQFLNVLFAAEDKKP